MQFQVGYARFNSFYLGEKCEISLKNKALYQIELGPLWTSILFEKIISQFSLLISLSEKFDNNKEIFFVGYPIFLYLNINFLPLNTLFVSILD